MTASKAMAAGIPQLIHPQCFDQVDNGVRVKSLGAGGCLRSGRSSGEKIATALTALMTEEVRTRCCALSSRFNGVDACATSVGLVEKLAADRPTTSLP